MKIYMTFMTANIAYKGLLFDRETVSVSNDQWVVIVKSL